MKYHSGIKYDKKYVVRSSEVSDFSVVLPNENQTEKCCIHRVKDLKADILYRVCIDLNYSCSVSKEFLLNCLANLNQPKPTTNNGLSGVAKVNGALSEYGDWGLLFLCL